MKTAVRIFIFACVAFAAGLNIFAQALDISSGGAPTITGALSGSVTGSSSVQNDLSVTINFGEVSPSNINNIVRVVVPIAIRSNQPYTLQAAVTGATNANAQAIQRTDIGFGVNNFRSLGSRARVCTLSTHNFASPFNNDPGVTRTFDAGGRAAYPSTLNNLSVATTILTGPRLSDGNGTRQTNDGYAFDAIITITPQYYAFGSTTAVITFTISPGPLLPC